MKVKHTLALDGAKELENNSVNCIITSPPYWQLRDYGFSDQWGLEPTYQEYLEHLWSLFDVLKDKLTDDGTCWVNLGDSYSGSNRNGYKQTVQNDNGAYNSNDNYSLRDKTNRQDSLPDKCLMLIPHRFAIGMIDRGWILRNDIIWAKPNGMPESVTDRFSKKHEFIFFFVKSKKYYFDLDGVREKLIYGEEAFKPKRLGDKYAIFKQSKLQRTHSNPNGKNPGDVADFWAITTKPNSTNHYASYNSQLIDKPIIAGCPKGGVILDPFAGTGTTLTRAMQLERDAIGFEGKKEYCDLANKNLEPYLIQNNLFKVA